MNRATLDEIEEKIEHLTPEEQLWLIERLAHKIRSGRAKGRPPRVADLEAMASDPQVQAELRKIEEEFRGTEADGLEKL